MRVALDAIPLVAAKTGIGHYTDALAEWLARTHPDHQYTLLSPFDFTFPSERPSLQAADVDRPDIDYNDEVDRDDADQQTVAKALSESTPNDDAQILPANLTKQFSPTRSIFRKWWLFGLPALSLVSPFDIFHGTNYCVPLWGPFRTKCPSVSTIHDLSLFNQSDTHETDNVRRGKRRIPLMARRATLIIAPSEFTKREILAKLNIKEHKIRVIGEGARAHMRPQREAQIEPVLTRLGIRTPYILYVGTIEPRKNLLTLLRAYHSLLHTTEHQPQLVLAGGKGWLYEEVFDLVNKLKLQDQVTFTGYVNDADLPALYSAAQAFVYPSLYEGFGLPPLEAMSCGAPVITSNTTSLPEVVGDAGLTHDPLDADALTAAMAKLLTDPHAQTHFRQAGLERAQIFTWERAARETQQVYDEVYRYWYER